LPADFFCSFPTDSPWLPVIGYDFFWVTEMLFSFFAPYLRVLFFIEKTFVLMSLLCQRSADNSLFTVFLMVLMRRAHCRWILISCFFFFLVFEFLKWRSSYFFSEVPLFTGPLPCGLKSQLPLRSFAFGGLCAKETRLLFFNFNRCGRYPLVRHPDRAFSSFFCRPDLSPSFFPRYLTCLVISWEFVHSFPD